MHLVRSVQVHLGGLCSNSMQLSWKSLLCSPVLWSTLIPAVDSYRTAYVGHGNPRKLFVWIILIYWHILCLWLSARGNQKLTLRKCQGWSLGTGIVRILIPPRFPLPSDTGKGTQHSCATVQSLNKYMGLKLCLPHKVMVKSSGILHCTLDLVDRKCLLWLQWRQWTHNFNI